MSDTFPVFAAVTRDDENVLAGRRFHRMSGSVMQSWRKTGGKYAGYADAEDCIHIEDGWLTPCRACIPVRPPS